MTKKSKHPREFFDITKLAKMFRYTSNTFNITISHKTTTDITACTLAVAEAFGIGVDRKRQHLARVQNLQNLRELSIEEVKRCENTLAKIRHHRLSARVSEKPYTNHVTYRTALEKAGIEKTTKMLRVLSILMQTEVYLLWKRAS